MTKLQTESFISSLYKITSEFNYVENEKSIFEIFSDHFYKENFHSDILAYYLNHKEVMSVFLDWIDKENINKAEYSSFSIDREKHRIDLTIYNKNKDRAIIIENKSNDHSDRNRQIPDYVNKLTNKNIIIDKVIYINKFNLKKPDTTGWADKEKKDILSKIKCVQLVGVDSLSDNLIKTVISTTDNTRLLVLSQEIMTMFVNVTKNVKNLSVFEELYVFLEKKDNREQLKNIVDTYNNIPRYLMQLYKDYYEQNKDDSVILIRPHNYTLFVLEMKFKNTPFNINVDFSDSGVNIFITSKTSEDPNCDKIKDELGDKFLLKKAINEKNYNLKINYDNMFNKELVIHEINNLINSFK